MIRKITIPMHKENGSLVSLSNLLEAIPDNEWRWIIIEFYGIGSPPHGMTMDEFEESIRNEPNGLTVSWAELKEMGKNIEQTYDFLAVAYAPNSPLEVPPTDTESLNDSLGQCILIRAFDSMEWTVEVSDRLGFSEKLISAIARMK
ncbi:hypothetical protein [Streptosporangium sp. NPDC049046]|uniref:hypothetical protein n=1 Tax=Streptosporangium sp. NPDC049046 TaxID=3155031 RepID=UPI003449F152